MNLLNDERAAWMERMAKEEATRKARLSLNNAGWKADLQEVEDYARERWEKMTKEEATAVMDQAARLQAEGDKSTRRIFPAEIQEDAQMTTQKEMAAKIREATADVLTKSPDISAGAAYLIVKDRTGMTNQQIGWENTYFYSIRKRLRAESGKAPPPPKKTIPPSAPASNPAAEETYTPPEAVDIPSPDVELKEEVAELIGENEEGASGGLIHIDREGGSFYARQLPGGNWSLSLQLEGLTGDQLSQMMEQPSIDALLAF